MSSELENLERQINDRFDGLKELLESQLVTIRQAIEFGDKQSAQTVALIVPQLQRNTDDIKDAKLLAISEAKRAAEVASEAKKTIDEYLGDQRNKAFNLIYTVIGSVAAVIIAGIITNALTNR